MSKSLGLFITCESQVHAGGGDGTGVIDRQIQRSTTTGLPEFFANTLKGALKSAVRRSDPELATRAFGSEIGQTTDGQTTPALVSVSAARLVAFPMPFQGRGFGWVTSRFALAETVRLLRGCGGELPNIPDEPPGSKVFTATGQDNNQVVLGDVLFESKKNEQAENWAERLGADALPSGDSYKFWRTKLTENKDLLVVSDDTLRYLTLRYTQVDDQIALEIPGTEGSMPQVSDGAGDDGEIVGEPTAAAPVYTKQVKNLWSTEYLPRDTLMVARLDGPGKEIDEVCRKIVSGPFVIGGDESTGKGRVYATARPQL